MTTHKGFKRAVRARMAKTGERYAAARRALLAASPEGSATTTPPDGYRYRGGLQPLSASLTNVLAHRDVRSGLTGRALGEAEILGIGGGLGAGYILWEFKARGGAVLTLGFGNRWQYPGSPGWTGTILDRLGIEASVHETTGSKGAARTLDGILDDGDPAIVYVDQGAIGTWGQPDALSGFWGYPVVVAGRAEDGRYLVDDRGRGPLLVEPDVLARARGRIGSYRHRLIEVRTRDIVLSPERLRAATWDGLRDQVEHLRAPSDSFALPAWRKWSRLLTDERNAKGWPTVFAEGRGLFGALLSVVEGVDGDVGATGGHLRALYASALDQAAISLDSAALSDAADRWREAADLWEDFADAAVPPDLAHGLEAIEAAEQLHDAVMEGEPGRDRARRAAGRLWGIRADQAGPLDVPPGRLRSLYEDLGERLAAIHTAEVAAVDATARAFEH